MGRVTYIVVLAGLLLGGLATLAEPYWIEWEGDDWPENENPAWERNWGNWNGQYHGGAYRTLENGILTYDSLYDFGVFDFYEMDRAGEMDPGPQQVFIMEWRVKVEQVVGYCGDPGVSVTSDSSRKVGFDYWVDHVESVFEPGVIIPIAPGVFHDYRLVSADMAGYKLYIDGQLARVGSFWQGVSPAYVAWGDGCQGGASFHEWDYFRFGAVSAVVGDVNCDGSVDIADINPFVAVLSGREASQGCPAENADINGDGQVNFVDINAFVDLLRG